jgi:chromosomal replication initiator protein
MQHDELEKIIRSHYTIIKKLEEYVSSLPKKFRSLSAPVDYIITEVEREFFVDVTIPTRKKKVMYARHCAVYLLRKHTSLTWQEIAYQVGNSDHSTSIHSYRAATNLLHTDDAYRLQVETIQIRLSEVIKPK